MGLSVPVPHPPLDGIAPAYAVFGDRRVCSNISAKERIRPRLCVAE